MIEQFFLEVEGPDRDWMEEDYYGDTEKDRPELIMEPWNVMISKNTKFG